jgi:hypothetical protein
MENLSDLVNKLIVLQSQYAEIYNENDEMVAVSEDCVHVEPGFFYNMCIGYKLKWTVTRQKSNSYPFRATVFLCGVRFITIGTFEDFQAWNLISRNPQENDYSWDSDLFAF